MASSGMRDPGRRAEIVLAFGILLAHLAVSGRYGFFRDELYFIDCGRHPAFGYVDQPPLVPLLAAATQLFGNHLPPLRALGAVAHAALVLACAALAGLVAEEARAPAASSRAIAAAAAALAPMFLGLHSTLNTTVFEPLSWTLIALWTARAVVRSEPPSLIAAGAACGLALQAKYAVPFFVVPLVAGMTAGPSRRVLATRSAAIAAAIGVLLALPSALWQLAHGLPFLQLLRAASGGKNVVVPPLAFVANQIGVMNPALAPLWILGVLWALFSQRVTRLRFLAIAFAGVFLEMLLLHGKDYYLAPAYGVAFALGAVATAAHVPWKAARAAWLALALAIAVLAAPLAMPILDPPVLARYERALSLQPQPQENNQRGALLPQLFADMLGWPELEGAVQNVWRALSAEERKRAAIITSNYGEAGAINFFGPKDGLPRAISGHNQYWLWGPGEGDPRVVLRVNGTVERWQALCDEVKVAATFGGVWVMPYESGRPILLCRGLRESLRSLWPELRHYD